MYLHSLIRPYGADALALRACASHLLSLRPIIGESLAQYMEHVLSCLTFLAKYQFDAAKLKTISNAQLMHVHHFVMELQNIATPSDVPNSVATFTKTCAALRD